jgi:hypothetical protein
VGSVFLSHLINLGVLRQSSGREQGEDIVSIQNGVYYLLVFTPLLSDSFVSTLLSMVSLAIGACLAVVTYVFTAHTLKSPFHAPIAAVLGGLLSCLVVWFSTCLVVDVADTLYLCYCLDRDAGAQHSKIVFGAVSLVLMPPAFLDKCFI